MVTPDMIEDSPSTDPEQNFNTIDQVIEHAGKFADLIESKKEAIDSILRSYESKQVIDDEIRQSIDALKNIGAIKQYFEGLPLSEKTSVFLPLNLPLFSLVLNGIIPAYQSKSVVIRAPDKMKDLFVSLFNELEINTHLPTVTLFTGTREDFVEDHCNQSSVVIFTGKHDNFQKLQQKLYKVNKEALLLYNGVGHNPIVVASDANVKLAVTKSIEVQTYNSGQDCAAPNVIFVHKDKVVEYLEVLKEQLVNVFTSNSYKADVVAVGPLFDRNSLLNAMQMILRLQSSGAIIEYGGIPNLRTNVLGPTVLKTHIRDIRNYDEPYSPLFIITVYDNDEQLKLYFDDAEARYDKEAMYVSLFGSSRYLEHDEQKSILLREKTIHDIESSVGAFGGYGPGASSVSYKDVTIAKPLLIPAEIFNYLSIEGRKIFEGADQTKLNGNEKRDKMIENAFKEKVVDIFGSDALGFITDGFSTGKPKRYSSIDTFICADQISQEQVKRYEQWLFGMHELFGKIPNRAHLAHIMTFSQLQTALISLDTIELSADHKDINAYNAVRLAYMLLQAKRGSVGMTNYSSRLEATLMIRVERLIESYLSSLDRRPNGVSRKEFLSQFGQRNVSVIELPIKILKKIMSDYI